VHRAKSTANVPAAAQIFMFGSKPAILLYIIGNSLLKDRCTNKDIPCTFSKREKNQLTNYYNSKWIFRVSTAVTTPRYLLLDEIEHLSQSAQASILSLLQDGVLTETKVSKTRSIEFKCSVFASCNSIKKLKEPLVSRLMVISMESYNQGEFVNVAVEQLKKRGIDEGFAWFIAQEVWKLPDHNIRECVRLASLCSTEEDVIKMPLYGISLSKNRRLLNNLKVVSGQYAVGRLASILICYNLLIAYFVGQKLARDIVVVTYYMRPLLGILLCICYGK
jgi:hypothetical protein